MNRDIRGYWHNLARNIWMYVCVCVCIIYVYVCMYNICAYVCISRNLGNLREEKIIYRYIDSTGLDCQERRLANHSLLFLSHRNRLKALRVYQVNSSARWSWRSAISRNWSLNLRAPPLYMYMSINTYRNLKSEDCNAWDCFTMTELQHSEWIHT